jgi:6-phosphogluconolactonase (cycloisomerase 2 family)
VGRGYNGKHFVSASLVVCGFDAKTGRRKELGRVPCPEASSLAVAPDGKTAYVMPRTGGKLLRFGIDGEGAVKPAGEDAGEKFAGRNLAASPDGKYLYWLRCTADKPTKPDQEMLFIEIAALGADGQVTHQETVEYKPPPGPIKFKNLYLAPDGGHAYLYVWDYKKGCDFGMIYARDAATGKLRLLDYQNEFKGKMYHLDFATPELGTCRNWRFGEKSAVTLFRRDSKTGQMADCGNLEGVTRIGWIAWAGSQYIAEKSALYVTGNDMNKGLRGIYVVRLEPAHWAPAAGK